MEAQLVDFTADFTAQFGPVYIGMLVMLAVSGLGIVFSSRKSWMDGRKGWKLRFRGVSFSSGVELPSRNLLRHSD